VHRTLSGTPAHSTLKFFAPFQILSQLESFYWFVLSLMHL
jgi:hypothetical protein